MTTNYVLTSSLSVTLTANTSAYIQIKGFIEQCLIGLDFLEITGSAVIQSTISDSPTFEKASTYSDLNWENIYINGVEMSAVTNEIKSMLCYAPTYFYIQNNGLTTIRFNCKGLR